MHSYLCVRGDGSSVGGEVDLVIQSERGSAAEFSTNWDLTHFMKIN